MRNEKVIEYNALVNMASRLLPADTFNHAVRVMQYVMSNPLIPEDIHDDCIVVAIAHDLLEDTNINIGNLPICCGATTINALQLLTKEEDVEYVDYIKNLKQNFLMPAGQIAYWVKMADMKDHLAQKDTLTDRLKKKYLEALPFLLP